MKRILFLFNLILCLLVGTIVSAHPGSGIVIDKFGNVFFTDTGKGVWEIDTKGKLTYIPASKFHWMTIDPVGYFAESQKTFGEHFESDKDENINPEFYGSENNLDFSEANGFTTVRITIKYKTLAILEMMIEKGFKEGFTKTLNNLEKLLATLSQK